MRLKRFKVYQRPYLQQVEPLRAVILPHVHHERPLQPLVVHHLPEGLLGAAKVPRQIRRQDPLCPDVVVHAQELGQPAHEARQLPLRPLGGGGGGRRGRLDPLPEPCESLRQERPVPGQFPAEDVVRRDERLLRHQVPQLLGARVRRGIGRTGARLRRTLRHDVSYTNLQAGVDEQDGQGERQLERVPGRGERRDGEPAQLKTGLFIFLRLTRRGLSPPQVASGAFFAKTLSQATSTCKTSKIF